MTSRMLLIAVVVLLAACAGTPNLARYETRIVASSAVSGDGAGAELQGITVRSGDIVVSEVDAGASLLLNLMAERYAPYVHAGIVVVDDGEAFVHHAFASFWPVPGRAPTTTMSGRIRREALDSYLGRREVVSIARIPDPVAAARIGEFARTAHRERLAFDPFFDIGSEDAVYCTEFVARAMLAAGVTPPAPAPRSANRSMNLAFDWLQIDTDGFWLAGELIAGLEPVATLSRTLTPAQVEARFAFRAEVHRRFSAEQPLGNVFRWSALGLSLRPHIKAAYRDAVTAAESTFDRTAFEQLVNDRLGPAKYPATRLAEYAEGASHASPR